MPRVLILCTGNSCRSQMAEAIWRQLGGSTWEVVSAGSTPTGFVHPLAIEVLQDRELPTAGLVSKSVDTFANVPIDVVVTVCDHAQQQCPSFPGATEVLHWPFPDPAHASGSADEQKAAFEQVANDIESAIADYLQARNN